MANNRIKEIQRFRRQYFQLLDLKDLSWPAKEALRSIETQEWLYVNLFNADSVTHPPPKRYQLRVLKQLLRLIEESIEDPDEDEISDDLSSVLANLLSQTLPAEAIAAQQPSYVTYSFASNSGNTTPIVTLLESRSVIASSGTTGRRTWEAALHLGRYLVQSGSSLVSEKKILELGAGTGLVSILCARWLNAQHVTATDGDDTVVEDLQKNIFLNGLEGSSNIHAKSLRWGQVLEEDEGGQPPDFDVVLGADITYDASVIPALVATFRELFTLNRSLDILIASTVRNVETFAVFVSACQSSQLSIVDIDFPVQPAEQQEGPFYSTTCPIRIVRVKQRGIIRDPFAI